MRRMKSFFAAHPRFTTGLHVVLAVLPSVTFLMMVVVFVLSCMPGVDFYGVWLPFMLGTFLAIICCPGIFWLLSLLLYRFTHAVREKWPDKLRMALIRFNILGGFLTIIQLVLVVMILIRK